MGFSDIGCLDCHDDSGIARPSIAIVGPTTVDPGTQVTYQVVVTRMADSQLGAGFNFATSGGRRLGRQRSPACAAPRTARCGASS